VREPRRPRPSAPGGAGEENAENVLEIHDSELADRLAAYVDEVRALYPRFTPT
jgi:hypothetical protein